MCHSISCPFSAVELHRRTPYSAQLSRKIASLIIRHSLDAAITPYFDSLNRSNIRDAVPIVTITARRPNPASSGHSRCTLDPMPDDFNSHPRGTFDASPETHAPAAAPSPEPFRRRLPGHARRHASPAYAAAPVYAIRRRRRAAPAGSGLPFSAASSPSSSLIVCVTFASLVEIRQRRQRHRASRLQLRLHRRHRYLRRHHGCRQGRQAARQVRRRLQRQGHHPAHRLTRRRRGGFAGDLPRGPAHPQREA